MTLQRTSLFVAVGAALLLLAAALLWWPDAGHAQNSGCPWDQHDHNGTCHSKSICHAPHCASAPATPEPPSASAQTCNSPYHSHGDTCHKHCKNAGQDHGEDCSVSNPTPTPTREPDPDPTPTPTPIPCPADVTGFQVDSVTDSSVTVKWNTPSASPYGYKIESCSSSDASCPDATQVATPSGSATSHTLTDLNRNTSYFFRIVALAFPNSSCQDSAASSIITATTTKTRLVVDNFRASSVTSTTVTLKWDAATPAAGLDKYKIESCSSSDASCPDATQVATPAKTETSYTVTGLDSSTTYYYRLTALAIPNSNYLDSDPASTRGTTTGNNNNNNPQNLTAGMVQVHTALAPVTGLAAACANSSDSVSLAWTAPTSTTNIANFQIQRCATGDCTNPVADGTPAASATSHTVKNLSANTTYYFRIRAVAKMGYQNSDWSSTVNCTTSKLSLPAITGFSVDSNNQSGGVPLVWDVLTHTALDKYRVEVCSSTQCTSPTGYDATSASHNHTCTPGDACYYRVRAKAKASSDYVDGPWSAFVIVSIPAN